MAKQKPYGKCHICGCIGLLTYEHVPPRKAFNDRPILYAKMEQLLEAQDLDSAAKLTNQKGAGAHTLCAKCNNQSGHWYGSSYVDFAYQALSITSAALDAPSLYYPFHIFPLRVIKQVMCMFCSTNGASFAEKNDDIIRFVLNRDASYLPDRMKVYMYYNLSGRCRTSGVAGMIDLSLNGGTRVFSEIAHPPFGFILTLDGMPPTANCLDITPFAGCNYMEFRSLHLKVPILEINSYFPGDFRSKKQIELDVQKNRKDELTLQAQ
jgi:hypothetical protein